MDNVILRAEALMKTYGGNGTFVNAVERVTVSFYERQVTAIVGASGSGKSTLLHLLGGIDVPSGGTVYLYGRDDKEAPTDLYALSRDELAELRGRNFGFVFQNYALLPVLTAWENVMIPSIYNGTEFDREFAEHLFERLGIAERMHHLPSEMSGGEQQRTAVIRAMCTRPRILFADEPTGNLDRRTGEELIELLFELRNETNSTIIMVTHDERVAASADRVLRMEDGSLRSAEVG